MARRSLSGHNADLVARSPGLLCEQACVGAQVCRPAARGESCGGGLRRPIGPVQVNCVLAVAVLAAVPSIPPACAHSRFQSSVGYERAVQLGSQEGARRIERLAREAQWKWPLVAKAGGLP